MSSEVRILRATDTQLEGFDSETQEIAFVPSTSADISVCWYGFLFTLAVIRPILRLLTIPLLAHKFLCARFPEGWIPKFHRSAVSYRNESL